MENDVMLLSSKVSRLEDDLKEERIKRGNADKELDGRLRKLENGMAVSDTKLNTILDKLQDMSDKVDGLLSKPGKRWEAVVGAILSAVVGAVITFLAIRLGMR